MNKFCNLLVFTILFNCLELLAQDGKILSVTSINYQDLSFYGEISDTNIQTGKIDLNENYRYLNNITFDSIRYLSDGIEIAGYLLQPKKEGKFPCIIFNRGGHGDFGMLNEALLIYRLSYLVESGYIIVASNYRGNKKSLGQDQFGGDDIHDVLNLIPSLNYLPKADTSRIGMYGWSRGGMMTYIALSKTNQIKAAVVSSGPSDLYRLALERPKMEENVFAKMIPDYSNKKEEELNKRSVIKWVNQLPENTPILIMHGSNDWRVSPQHVFDLGTAFLKSKLTYKIVLFENGSHGLDEHEIEYKKMVLDWYNNYLK